MAGMTVALLWALWPAAAQGIFSRGSKIQGGLGCSRTPTTMTKSLDLDDHNKCYRATGRRWGSGPQDPSPPPPLAMTTNAFGYSVFALYVGLLLYARLNICGTVLYLYSVASTFHYGRPM